MTSPSDLFELDRFAHCALFDGVEQVWQALDRLIGYLDCYDGWGVFGQVASSAVIVRPVFIGRGTVIEPHAMVIGPAVIGENCVIRHSAYLRGYVLTGNDCIIGHCTEVKSSILLDAVRAPHFNYVGDSIVGNDVNLGAGTICANLRLDERKVSVVEPGGEKIATGRAKLGAIIGDGSRTACNVVLDPGTVVPRGSFVSQAGDRPLAIRRGG